MKKAFIALAVAAGAIASAHADTTTLYGNIGYQADFTNLNAIKDSDDKSNTFVKTLQHGINLSNITSSKIGVKGTEELGHGVSAMFGYEFGIDFSTKKDPVTKVAELSANGINKTKKAYVGFTGDFGTLTLGKKKGVYSDDYIEKANYFNTAEVFESVAYDYHGGIRYDVPSFVDGVDGSIAYDFLGQTIEVGAGFNMYGVDLGAALQYNWGRTGLTTGDIKSDRDSKAHIRAGLSAAYENDMFKVAADYQFKQASDKDADNAQHLVGLGAGFKVTGDSTLYAGGQLDAMNLNKAGATQRFGLGYEYNLSKRTKSFVEFDGNRQVMGDNKDDQYNFNAYIGLRHKF